MQIPKYEIKEITVKGVMVIVYRAGCLVEAQGDLFLTNF
jgi:hypothetical protein